MKCILASKETCFCCSFIDSDLCESCFRNDHRDSSWKSSAVDLSHLLHYVHHYGHIVCISDQVRLKTEHKHTFFIESLLRNGVNSDWCPQVSESGHEDVWRHWDCAHQLCVLHCQRCCCRFDFIWYLNSIYIYTVYEKQYLSFSRDFILWRILWIVLDLHNHVYCRVSPF